MTVVSKGNVPREYLYRKGKYIYFRHPATKELTPLPRDEASQEFEDAYGPLLRAAKGQNDPAPAALAPALTAKASRFEQATIGWLIGEYLASPGFLKKAATTQACYRRDLDRIRAHDIAHGLLHDMTPQRVDVFSGKMLTAYGAATADAMVTLISNLWNFARVYECFKRGDKHNPTIGRLRHYEHDEDGHLAWPDDVIDKFDGWADPYLRQYRMGLHYTGQRGGDVLAMKWDDYQRGKIHVVQEKTGERLWITCPAKLKVMLDAMPRISPYIFTSSRGRPYASAASLSNCLKFFMNKHGLFGYVMHGLRKNAGMELALAGCTVNEIMSVLGHKSPKMAIFYCKQADKVRLAETAAAKWDAHITREDAAKAEDKQARVTTRRKALKAV
jgi:integrase